MSHDLDSVKCFLSGSRRQFYRTLDKVILSSLVVDFYHPPKTVCILGLVSLDSIDIHLPLRLELRETSSVVNGSKEL